MSDIPPPNSNYVYTKGWPDYRGDTPTQNQAGLVRIPPAPLQREGRKGKWYVIRTGYFDGVFSAW